MNRQEADEALELLRNVVGRARDDTSLQNWGVIWILHAFTNGGGFVATQILIDRGYTNVWVFAGMWTLILAANFLSIFLLQTRTAGARTFIETQIWVIWTSYIGAVALTGAINSIGEFELFALGPVVAILSGMAFCMMGGVIGRNWFAVGALFGLLAPVMAIFPAQQFTILGVTWGTCQFVSGVRMHLNKKRRLADEANLV